MVKIIEGLGKAYPNGSTPLVDIESEGPEWLDWCAALYESHAADHESMVAGIDRASRVRYASAAESVAEDLEYAIYEADAEDRAWEYGPDAAGNDHLSYWS